MNIITDIEHQKARAATYKLLSEGYYPPDPDLSARIRNSGESVPELCSAILKDFPGPEGVEALSVDYARLFVGPFMLLAPPYGSVYLESDGRIMGKSTADARNRYRAEGLDVALKEVPDHIAIELEYMHFLVCQATAALAEDNAALHAECTEKQQNFLKDHLGAWVADFAEKVAQHANTDFYKSLAAATESAVSKDLSELSQP